MFAPAAAIFALLLVATGIAKLRKPMDTAIALSRVGLPRHQAVGFAIGAMELGVGVFVLATMSVAALALQGLLYLGFTTWIAVAMARGVPIASCGCLGTDDTPPYWGHLTLDTVAVGVTAMAILSRPFAYPDELVGIVALTSVVAVGAYLCWAIIGEGARLHGAVRR